MGRTTRRSRSNRSSNNSSSRLWLHAIDDSTQNASTHLLEPLFAGTGDVTRGHAGADDINHPVDPLGQNARVGDVQDRRRVEKDHVGCIAELADKLSHSLGPEQLCRVRGDGARSQQPHPFKSRVLEGILPADVPRKNTREPHIIAQPEMTVQCGLAEVGAHQDDMAARQSERHTQVRGDGALPLTRPRARDDNRSERAVKAKELQVGPQRSNASAAGDLRSPGATSRRGPAFPFFDGVTFPSSHRRPNPNFAGVGLPTVGHVGTLTLFG